MRRLCTDHAARLSDAHRLADGCTAVYPADGRKPQKAAVLNIGDDQPDLIHMCGKHQAVCRLLCAALKSEQIAQGVHLTVAAAVKQLQ